MVFEVVVMGGVYRKGFVYFRIFGEVIEKVEKVLEFVGFGGIGDRFFCEFFGG